MPITDEDKAWYIGHIRALDPNGKVVVVNEEINRVVYSPEIESDEDLARPLAPEELVRALSLVILTSAKYRYEPKFFTIEKHYSVGRPSEARAEIDLIIYEEAYLAFSVWDFKAPDEFSDRADYWIQHQLFDPAPLIGAPKYLVYATIFPNTAKPELTLWTIDYQEYTTFEKWVEQERPYSESFPADYEDEETRPLMKGTAHDLKTNATHGEFRALAQSFHQAFFGEKQDTELFRDLLKLIIGKIYDERTTNTNQKYAFQVYHHGRKEEAATELFERIRGIYRTAYKNFIEPGIPDEQIPDLYRNEFSPDKVKFVVRKLQRLSLTRNNSGQGDIVGSFFEEILRDGFKQDKGMYFTHSNLVHFMVEAIDLRDLAIRTFSNATHHSNRMPYIIDPACGSGTFLLVAMNTITKAIMQNKDSLITNDEAMEFFNHYLAPDSPNLWAKDFIYGIDPKFVMALTSKANMVLHGDGSAHIYRYDGLNSFSEYNDSKLNEIPRRQSTVTETQYDKPVCERFDALLTNPPFGISIDEVVKRRIPQNYTLSEKSDSDALFFERWFQLLKPKGRLAAVLPESFFNTAENLSVRILLYRLFNIKAIVSLPQNLFYDTPTSTSLLFAQKKTREQIEQWDNKWRQYERKAGEVIDRVLSLLRTISSESVMSAREQICRALEPLLRNQDYVIKKGKPPVIIIPNEAVTDVNAFKAHLKQVFKLADFRKLILGYVFSTVASELNYSFRTYCVDEVGYKLSKRGEKPRPNQLCLFMSEESSEPVTNLHRTDEVVEVSVDTQTPQTVLDLIRRDVSWD